jgi:hypothetical protein
MGVMLAIAMQYSELSQMMEKLFWIEPSWILIGVKRRVAVDL